MARMTRLTLVTLPPDPQPGSACALDDTPLDPAASSTQPGDSGKRESPLGRLHNHKDPQSSVGSLMQAQGPTRVHIKNRGFPAGMNTILSVRHIHADTKSASQKSVFKEDDLVVEEEFKGNG